MRAKCGGCRGRNAPPLELHINLDAIRVGVFKNEMAHAWPCARSVAVENTGPIKSTSGGRHNNNSHSGGDGGDEAIANPGDGEREATESAFDPEFDFECESESDEEIFYGYELLLSNASSSSDDDTSATHSRFKAFVFGYGSDGAGVFDYEAGNRLEEVVEGFTDDDECDEMTALLLLGDCGASAVACAHPVVSTSSALSVTSESTAESETPSESDDQQMEWTAPNRGATWNTHANLTSESDHGLTPTPISVPAPLDVASTHCPFAATFVESERVRREHVYQHFRDWIGEPVLTADVMEPTVQCALNVVDVVGANAPPLELHINLDAIRVGVFKNEMAHAWPCARSVAVENTGPIKSTSGGRHNNNSHSGGDGGDEAIANPGDGEREATESAFDPEFDFECESESDEEIFYGYELLLSNASSSSDDDTSATHSRFKAFVFGYGSDGAGVFDYEAGNRLEEVVEGFTDDDECDEMTALLLLGDCGASAVACAHPVVSTSSALSVTSESTAESETPSESDQQQMEWTAPNRGATWNTHANLTSESDHGLTPTPISVPAPLDVASTHCPFAATFVESERVRREHVYQHFRDWIGEPVLTADVMEPTVQCALNVVDVVGANAPPLELHINLDAIRVGVFKNEMAHAWPCARSVAVENTGPIKSTSGGRHNNNSHSGGDGGDEAIANPGDGEREATESAFDPEFDFECESESDEEIFYGYELLLSNASSSSDDDTSATHSRFKAFVFGYGSDGAGVFDYEAGNRLEEVVEGFTDDDECDEMTALLLLGDCGASAVACAHPVVSTSSALSVTSESTAESETPSESDQQQMEWTAPNRGATWNTHANLTIESDHGLTPTPISVPAPLDVASTHCPFAATFVESERVRREHVYQHFRDWIGEPVLTADVMEPTVQCALNVVDVVGANARHWSYTSIWMRFVSAFLRTRWRTRGRARGPWRWRTPDQSSRPAVVVTTTTVTVEETEVMKRSQTQETENARLPSPRLIPSSTLSASRSPMRRSSTGTSCC